MKKHNRHCPRKSQRTGETKIYTARPVSLPSIRLSMPLGERSTAPCPVVFRAILTGNAWEIKETP